MAERLVFTLEVWVAAMAGEPFPEPARRRPAARASSAPRRAFARIARAIRDRGAWDDAFVDALCEPPQSFTYGGVVAHVAHLRRDPAHALAGVLAELGAEVSVGDPIEWESRWRPSSRNSRARRAPGQRLFVPQHRMPPRPHPCA